MSGAARLEFDRSRVQPSANISRVSGLAELQAQTRGDRSVCIAIIDGPVDLSHPCLVGADITMLGSRPADVTASGAALGHGTHVASVVFGQPGTSVEGLAPDCRGLLVPVFTDGPDGMISPCFEIDLARAITLAAEHGADIINISGGRLAHGGEAGQFLTDAVKQSADQGVLVVAAGGNDGCDCLHVPAALPNVIAVGAMDAQGRPLESSNWGHRYLEQGVLALGDGILGAAPDGKTATLTGTSFAAPIVSGVAGLLLSLQHLQGEAPDGSVVRDAILDTVNACDPQSSDDCRRHLVGTLNVWAAQDAIARASRARPDTLAASALGNCISSVSDLVRRDPMTSVSEEHVAIHPSSAISGQAPGPASSPVHATHPGVDIRPNDASMPEAGSVAASGPASSVAAPPVAALEQTVVGPATPSSTAIEPSACCAGCAAAERAQLVYALGHLGYDFGTEARRDFFAQMMPTNADNPFVPQQLLNYLESHPYDASSVIWTLNLDATPIYAVQPAGPYSAIGYERLREFLAGQGEEGVEFVSIPGVINGNVQLFSGQVVPIVVPAVSGMFSWSITALVGHIFGTRPKDGDKVKLYDEQAKRLSDFLSRIYFDLRNLGMSAEQRALNYSATNAVQVANVMRSVTSNKLDLDLIAVVKSPICRPESDCYDVELSFFDPNNIYAASQIFRFTVDVSDIVPVTIGSVRSWWRRT